MPGPVQPGIQDWLSAEIASSFAAAFEAITGEPCGIESAGPGTPAESTLYWRQKFSNVRGAAWIAAADRDWTTAGACVARAAGLPEDHRAVLKSEYLEIVAQACSALAPAISARLNREVACESGGEADPPAGDLVWTPLRIRIGRAAVQILAGVEAPLLEEFSQRSAAKPAFDLLLDVELPVSVSFGRAQIPLKDLLKLTTGSIVELNRSIGDPVEVIVNNCVIARGEVVVVDGNFGVRIQQVISRQERLRTLN